MATPSTQANAVPSVFQVLRSVRFEISKYLNGVSADGGEKRYSRGSMRGLKEMLGELLFQRRERPDSFEQAAMSEIDDCLDKFVNRSVKRTQVRLFENLDEVVSQVVFEQHRGEGFAKVNSCSI